MTDEDIIDLIKSGERGKAWHALGEKLHKPKTGGVHTNDSGNNNPPPPPPPPGTGDTGGGVGG